MVPKMMTTWSSRRIDFCISLPFFTFLHSVFGVKGLRVKGPRDMANDDIFRHDKNVVIITIYIPTENPLLSDLELIPVTPYKMPRPKTGKMEDEREVKRWG